MSETTDNLNLGISAEATSEGQAGSTESTEAASHETTAAESVDGLKARLAALEEELGKKNKQIENANKLIGRKVINKDDLANLGITPDQAEKVTEAAQGMTRQEAKQTAQAIGGNELETWFTNTAKQYGTAAAIQAMVNAYMPQFISQQLKPLNDQLEKAQTKLNQAAIESATNRLAEEFEDLAEKAEAIKAYWKANPKKYQQLVDPSTDSEDKYDILEGAYLKVSRVKSNNSAAASKAAGAVEARQREQAKNSSVTSGSGSRSGKDGKEKSPADAWLEEMLQHEAGSKLFD